MKDDYRAEDFLATYLLVRRDIGENRWFEGGVLPFAAGVTRAPWETARSIHFSTRSASPTVIKEEISVLSSWGWPILSFRVAAMNRSMNSSAMYS